MMNLKKSRKGIIALSVVTAFIMCSLATVYALASDEVVPATENPTYDISDNLVEDIADTDIFEEVVTDSAEADEDFSDENISAIEISEGDVLDSMEISDDYSDENTSDTDTSEDVVSDSLILGDGYSDENIEDTDVSEDVTEDSPENGLVLTEEANDDDIIPGQFTVDSNGQTQPLRKSNIKVFTYEEYVEWLEWLRIEYAGETFKHTNGNGEEIELSSDEVVEKWASIRERVKDGTTKFKAIINNEGVATVWGDFVFDGE